MTLDEGVHRDKLTEDKIECNITFLCEFDDSCGVCIPMIFLGIIECWVKERQNLHSQMSVAVVRWRKKNLSKSTKETKLTERMAVCM
jgi:hypothetical protein